MNTTTKNTPFKQTEIGPIPQDWEVKKLGEVIINVEYGSSAKSKPEGKVPVLRMGNIQNGKIDWTDLVYTEDDNEIKKYLLKKDDVLFNRTNTVDLVGKTGIYKGEIPAIFAGYLIRINRKEDLIDADYLTYLLNTKYAKNYGYLVLSIAVGQANINGTKLKTYPIPLPPTKAEQTAIATALSDTDALIGSLEKLIHKKRLLKQATMQHLLTPKEDWEVKKLGEMTNLMTNGFVGVATTHYTNYDNGILYIQGYNVEENSFNFNGIKKVTESFHKQHSKSCLQEGDLLTVQTGDVGLTTIVPKSLEGSNCHALIISRFKKQYYYPLFFSYYLNSNVGRNRLKEIEVGTTMKHINVGELSLFSVPVPPLAEQTRIATILSDMDAELSGLEAKLEKYRQLKQGMMQQLLTGKIRLV